MTLTRIACALLAVLLCAAPASHALDLGDSRVHLVGGGYSVAEGPGSLPAELRSHALPAAVRQSWVVCYRGPADEGLRAAIQQAGGRIVGHVPSSAWIVRACPSDARRVAEVPGVLRVDLMRPEWKVDPGIGTREFADPQRRAETDLFLTVEIFEGESVAAVADRVAATGAAVRRAWDRLGVRRLSVRASRGAVASIARIPEVEWIEEVGEITLRNDTVRWCIQSNSSGLTPVQDAGLLGEGEIVGHIDGPISKSSCFFSDSLVAEPGPTHRKLVSYRNDSAFQNPDSHGTHTAGTVAGDEEPVIGSVVDRGMAPHARLAHRAIWDVAGYSNTPSNLKDLLTEMHFDGAHIFTNSWGDDSFTSYTTWCRDIDSFAYQRQNDLVIFASTNTSTLKTPENAKNVLAVGATRRPAGGGEQDAIWSGGTGPTSDGRRKPEVFAPGMSTRSASTASCAMTTMSGTSMAAPAVAGAGALVREYLVKGYHPRGIPAPERAVWPTGALVKAFLIASTVDMTSVAGYPNEEEGWGRLLLDRVLHFPGDPERVWFRDVRHNEGPGPGAVHTHLLQVADAGQPLEITLVFTDYPAAPAAALTPVNDLDLEVVGPGGTFLGNVFDPAAGHSVTGGTADPLNNVERVILDSPDPGLYRVRVRASDVPEGPQGYALLVVGGLEPPQGMEGEDPGPPLPPPGPGRGGAPESGVDSELRMEGPNPFEQRVELRLTVGEPGRQEVTVYDVLGRPVRVLLDREVTPGEYPLYWNGLDESARRVPSGVYFVRRGGAVDSSPVRVTLIR